MGTEWDKEVVGKVDPQKRVLCLAQVFLRCRTAFANGVNTSEYSDSLNPIDEDGASNLVYVLQEVTGSANAF